MQPKHPGDLGGGLARLPLDVVPAVPERLLPGRGGGIVPGLVGPLVLMAQLPVQLHHDAVLVVDPVPTSPAPVGPGEPYLQARLRQAVRPLHIPVVPELQHRMVPARRGRDQLMQVGPPAQLGPCVHRLVQRGLVGEIPGERPGNPATDVIKRSRRLGKVKHGLLDLGTGWISMSQHELRGTPGTVNTHVGNRDDPTLPRDGHVNGIGRLVGQPVKLSRRLVAKHRAAASRQHRPPQPRPAARDPGKCCIDTGMDRPPPAAAHPELDHV
jgi:hypothetical protein